MNPVEVSKRERNLAALSHAAILFPGIGFVVPIIVWSSERADSTYLRFQSLQALSFQFAQVIFVQLLLLVEGLLILIAQGMISWLEIGGQYQELVLIVPVLMGALFFLIINLFYLAFGIVGAVRCLSGKAWLYPWLGEQVKNYLDNDHEAKDMEGRLVAAICHAGIFIPTSGILAPFLVWVLQKDFSAWLRFHSLQAMIIQVSWLVLASLLSVLEMIIGLPVLVSLLTSPDTLFNLANPRLVVIAVGGGVGLINIILFIFGPLLAVFATIAIIRILKGNDYSYPLFGKKLKERIIPA